MRKFFYVMMLAFCLGTLCGCHAEDMGPLPEFSKPYTGVYECTELRLGDRDMAEKFSFVRLELEDGGAFTLSYRTKTGEEGALDGTYEMDAAGTSVSFTADMPLRTVSRTFPVEKGVILIEMPLGGRALHAKFAMP